MQQKDKLPIIAITMGDPSGIGPEIIVKALSDEEVHKLCLPVIVGDKNILFHVIKGLGLENKIYLNIIHDMDQAVFSSKIINLINLSELKKYTPGMPQLDGGKAMVEYIGHAVKMALDKKIDAIVTCPISKFLMHKAGFPYDGHTPFISHLAGTEDYVMMLAGDRLKVSLVTIHCAIKDVPTLITEDLISRTILITANSLIIDFAISLPKIAVAALNPHAGENGLFGNEEETIVKGIVRAKEGLSSDRVVIYGPLSPDTVYYRAVNGEFDVVVSMYHDQGLIPLKLLHFSDAVNITLGLPIVRTSVDHGTAYDIAGKGIADSSSLKSAIKMAVRISKNRKKL